MKAAAACLTTLLLSTGAAACPVSESLIARHGISAAGFVSPPPVARPNADPAFLTITLSEPLLVSDGFRHTLFVDRRTKAAWIRRTGGLLNVREWYGPIDVSAWSLDGCRDDKEVIRDEAEAAAREFADPAQRVRSVRLTP